MLQLHNRLEAFVYMGCRGIMDVQKNEGIIEKERLNLI
jgi:hypothetical protein